MSKAKPRDPFVAAVKATLGVAVTVVVLGVIVYLVFKPMNDRANMLTYGWSDQDKAAFHRSGYTIAHDNCIADQFAVQKITYRDYQAGRASDDAITNAVSACRSTQ